MITEEGLGNQSGEITAELRERKRVIEDVAPNGRSGRGRLRGLKAFCKRDIPDGGNEETQERRGGEKMRNSYTLQQWGNQGSRINYDPPKVLLEEPSQTDFPMFSSVWPPSHLPCERARQLQQAQASRMCCCKVAIDTECSETWECAEFAVAPSVGRTSSSFARWELFLIDSHRRRGGGEDGFTDGGADVKAAAVRLGIRQAGAVRPSVRCSLPVSRMGEKGPEWE